MPVYDCHHESYCRRDSSTYDPTLDSSLIFLRMHTPYGVSLDTQSAHLVGKVVMLKLLFGVESIGNDYSDNRLITNFVGSNVAKNIQKAMPVQSLEEIVLNLALDGVEV